MKIKSAMFLKIPNGMLIFLMVITFSNCVPGSLDRVRHFDNSKIDAELGLSKGDYEKYFTSKKNQDQNKSSLEKFDYNDDNPIQPILAEPIRPQLSIDKIVTLSISEDVDVKDVLIELARLAEIDIEIDHQIQGGIILKVKDKQLIDVIDRVTELAGLAYSIENNILKISIDNPKLASYPVDFMNMTRNNRSNYKVNVGLQSGAQGGGAASGNASSSEIITEQTGDLWKTVAEDLNQIINSEKTSPANKSDIKNSTSRVLAVAGPNSNPGNSYISINREAGMVNVFARAKTHKVVQNYLAQIKTNVSAQALIEAKVVEIALNDEFKAGINWNMLDSRSTGFNLNFLDPVGTYTTGAGAFTFGVLNGYGRTNLRKNLDTSVSANLNTIVNLLDMFGVSRILSSPRLHAMNNQQAVLSFAQNYVYFQLKIDKTDSTVNATSGTTTTDTKVTSELKTVPIGLILNLQPSINLETSEITMNIRPTITRIVDTKKDPAIVYALTQIPTSASADLTSDVPVVEVKEMDSVLKIKSGEVMIIGGMMEERVNNTDSGVPAAQNIPLLGNLFKSTGRAKQVIQTVILIKATIINSNSNYNKKDKELFERFTNDPSPFKLGTNNKK